MDPVKIAERVGFQGFLREYANWEELSAVCVTFDVDFAPDYMISNVLRILDEEDALATFFATHRSLLLTEVARGAKHEVGLHPNLSADSTQGTSLLQIIIELKQSYPEAVGNRFHVLGYSYRDLAVLGKQGFRYDVSTLRYNCPYILPAWHQDLGMVLLTYVFEDGICENAGLPLTLSSIDLHSPGLKIINFHPLNVYLNGPDPTTRHAFLRSISDLYACPRDVADVYRCGGDGAEQLLRGLLRYVKARGCRFLRVREVADAYFTLANGEKR